MVGAMSLPNILNRLTQGVAILIPSDRAAALLPGLIAAHAAPTFPALSGIIMTGGMELPESVARLLDGMSIRLPVIITEGDTFETATRLSAVGAGFTPATHGQDRGRAAAVRGACRPTALLDRLHVDPVQPRHPADVRVRPHRPGPRRPPPPGAARGHRGADPARRRDPAAPRRRRPDPARRPGRDHPPGPRARRGHRRRPAASTRPTSTWRDDFAARPTPSCANTGRHRSTWRTTWSPTSTTSAR